MAHSVFLEKMSKPAEIDHYALSLAPHLLLWFYHRDTYGDRGAQLFYSPQTDADHLARVLLAAQLDTGQQEHQRIQVLRLAYNDLDFTPLPIKIPVLDLTTHYNDDLLPAHETILRHLRRKGHRNSARSTRHWQNQLYPPPLRPHRQA